MLRKLKKSLHFIKKSCYNRLRKGEVLFMFFKKLICTLLAAAVITGTVLPVYAEGEGTAEIAEAEAGIAAAEAEIAEAETEKSAAETDAQAAADRISVLKTEQTALQAYLDELNAELVALDQSLTQIQSEMETKETEIEMSKAAVERAKIEEQNQYDEMKKRIQYMYERSSSDYLVSLLNSSTVREFLNRADHFQEVNEYDRGRLADYQEARQIVMKQQETLEQEEASLEVLKSEYETKQAEVESLANTTGAKIVEFTQNISNEELTLSNLQQRIASQTTLLENLTEKLADAKARKEEEERKAAEAARLAEEKAAEEARLAAEKAEAEEKAAEVAKAAEEAKAQKEQEEALVRIEEAQKAATAKIEAVERDSGSSSDYTVKLRDDQLTYLGTFKLTAYCPCAQCCGWENGPTASGVYPTAEHTVAMAGVPFGTKLLINGRIYTVEDLGTPYGHADIFMNSHGTCLQFGVGYAEVYMVSE